MMLPCVHRLSVLCVSAAALTASANASAFTLSDIHNAAFTEADFPINSGFADQGGAAIMMASQMDSDCNNSVRHSMRYILEWDDEFRWVEVGFSGGLHGDYPCSYPIAYWGDLRGGTDYNEHTGGPYLNLWTRYMVLVQQSSGPFCAWDVWLDDIDGAGWMYLGTSTSNCASNDRKLEAGIFSTSADPSVFVQGWQWGWQRLDSSGTWQDGWENPLAIIQTSPPFIRSYTPAGCGQCEFEEVLNVPFSF